MSYWSQNLDDLRSENPTYKSKNPFPHQREAFEALSETAAAHPRAASCGASKAPPHENGTR